MISGADRSHGHVAAEYTIFISREAYKQTSSREVHRLASSSSSALLTAGADDGNIAGGRYEFNSRTDII